MNDEIRGEEAWSVDNKIKANELQRRHLLAVNAELLDYMYEKGLFKEMLGDEQGEWAGYLSDLSIFYSRNQVETYRRIAKKMKRLGIEGTEWVEVPITRLADILPLLTEDNYEEWFTNAKVLTTRDWNIVLRQAKGKLTEEEDHEHDNILYEICRKCGRKHKVHDTEESTEGHIRG